MQVDSGVLTSLRAAGAPAEVIDAAEQTASQQEGNFQVWPENWETLLVFLAVETQWRESEGMAGGRLLGINYPALESAMRLMRIKDKSEMFERVRMMEREAIKYLNSKK